MYISFGSWKQSDSVPMCRRHRELLSSQNMISCTCTGYMSNIKIWLLNSYSQDCLVHLDLEPFVTASVAVLSNTTALLTTGPRRCYHGMMLNDAAHQHWLLLCQPTHAHASWLYALITVTVVVVDVVVVEPLCICVTVKTSGRRVSSLCRRALKSSLSTESKSRPLSSYTQC